MTTAAVTDLDLDLAAGEVARLLLAVLGPDAADRFARLSPALGPVSATLFGTKVWTALDDTRRTLTWDGPGARVWLHKPARNIGGMAHLGARSRAVCGPVRTLAEAQAAVDAWTAAQLLAAACGQARP